jgi:hypothetical protein
MSGGVSVKPSTEESLALYVCRRLYEDTDGRPMEWRRAAGGHSIQNAVEHGVDHGWLLLNAWNESICLSDEGRRLVRKTLS